MTTELEASSPLAHSLYDLYRTGADTISKNLPLSFFGLEAIFYNRVKATPDPRADLTRLVNGLATNHFNSWQFIFASIGAYTAIDTAKKFIDLAESGSMMHTASQTILGSFLPAAILGFTLLCSNAILASHLMENPTPVGSTKFIKSKTQIFSAAVQITSIINTLALTAISQSTTPLLLTAAFNAYSLFKNTAINWLVFTKNSSGIMLPNHIKEIVASYSALLLQNSFTRKDCSVCHEEKPDHVVCTNGHALHRECINSSIESKMENFSEKEEDIPSIALSWDEEKPPKYTAYIPEKKLPSCPDCKERLFHPQSNISIHDKSTGKLNPASADVIPDRKTSTRDQRTFEKVNALYNTFQAGLTGLQQIPEFAPSITSLKSILLITDILSGLMTTYYLKRKLNENGQSFLKTCLSTAAVSIPIFSILNSTFGPSSRPPTFPGVSTEWESPFDVTCHGIWNIYRLLTSAELAYFSEGHKAINSISLITQGIGLWGALSLPWLRVGQEHIITGYWDLDRAKLHTYSIVSSRLAKHSSFLKQAIENIVSLQRKFLHNGAAKVTVEYRNGIFVGADASFSYELPKVSDIREYILKPFIWSSYGSVFHMEYGHIGLKVSSYRSS